MIWIYILFVVGGSLYRWACSIQSEPMTTPRVTARFCRCRRRRRPTTCCSDCAAGKRATVLRPTRVRDVLAVGTQRRLPPVAARHGEPAQ